MPDHININHPERRERDRQDHIKQAEQDARIKVLEMHLRAVESDLKSIFTRIERGDDCELHMPNGDVYVIKGELRG